MFILKTMAWQMNASRIIVIIKHLIFPPNPSIWHLLYRNIFRIFFWQSTIYHSHSDMVILIINFGLECKTKTTKNNFQILRKIINPFRRGMVVQSADSRSHGTGFKSLPWHYTSFGQTLLCICHTLLGQLSWARY